MRFRLIALIAACGTPLLAAPEEAAPAPVDIPIAIGQSVKQIRVPHHNARGELSLRLNAARAERSSSTEFTFDDLRIEIFDAKKEKAALEVLMPEAVFDQTSRRLASSRRSVIKGESLEISGPGLLFDVDSRTSRLRGPVTMTITGSAPLQP